jgi:glyoxylase-like metal-dependent hydrolase (beta-lactamase superfamily II)
VQTYHCIPLGTSKSYLIIGQSGLVLVDAGNKNYIKKFEHRLHDFHIPPDQIKLIIITHVHFDHVGSLNDIKELCGCEVAVHRNEASLLRAGTSVILLEKLACERIFLVRNNLLRNHATEFDKMEPEILVEEEMDLLEFGVKWQDSSHSRTHLRLHQAFCWISERRLWEISRSIGCLDQGDNVLEDLLIKND